MNGQLVPNTLGFPGVSSSMNTQVVFPRDLVLIHACTLHPDLDKFMITMGLYVIQCQNENELAQNLKTQRVFFVISNDNRVMKRFSIYFNQTQKLPLCVNSTLVTEQWMKYHYANFVTQIYFYERHEPFYFLTNFFNAPFIDKNQRKWPTSEHFFQAQKFKWHPQTMEYIRDQLRHPRAVVEFAQKNFTDPQLISQWRNGESERVMKEAVYQKFSQNDDLKSILLDTGNAILIEHTVNDNFWGDGGDGSGQNKLGIILMQVRQELRSAPPYRSDQNFPTAQTYQMSNTNCQMNQTGQYPINSPGIQPFIHLNPSNQVTQPFQRDPNVQLSSFPTSDSFSSRPVDDARNDLFSQRVGEDEIPTIEDVIKSLKLHCKDNLRKRARNESDQMVVHKIDQIVKNMDNDSTIDQRVKELVYALEDLKIPFNH